MEKNASSVQKYEFFIFDDVKWATDQEYTFFDIDSEEGAYNTGTEMEGGNMGHRPKDKGGYFPVPPVDSATDIRAEMVSTMTEMGIEMEKHHHEVAPSQHELGFKFGSLIESAIICKNTNIAYTWLHRLMERRLHLCLNQFIMTTVLVCMSINQFGLKVARFLCRKGYAGLSDTCLHYIGGIIKHAKAINAFSNATTNSYKRLVPGFEAPVILAY